MIKNVEKVFNVNETKLRYRKRETMSGLYFKEMLSKIKGSKNNENKPKDKKKENLDKIAVQKEDINTVHKNENDDEGNFLDELC